MLGASSVRSFRRCRAPASAKAERMTAKHRPSDESRKIVERAIGAGFTQPQVARLLGISDRSVRKHYKKELATGVLTATTR